MSGQLFVVARPIGNIKDITKRAIEIFESADIIAAEDTREFKVLAGALGLKYRKLVAYHDHNEENSASGLLALLREGKTIAVVSDAGTPGINDPAFRLVRKAFEEKIPVSPIPGASSLTSMLSVCPIGGISHYYGGFLAATSSKRKSEFKRLVGISDKLVFFESPHRLIDHLTDAQDVFGDIEVFIGREMTKSFETFYWSKISEAIDTFKEKGPKGEFVLVFGTTEPKELEENDEKKLDDWLKEQIKAGRPPKEILKDAKNRSKMDRKMLYKKILELKGK